MGKGALARLLRTLARYAVSLAALGVAAAITLVILHFKLPRQLVNYGFLAVIIGSAWWGGYGPGLFTTLTTVLLGPYLVVPGYSLGKFNEHGALWGLPEVVLISTGISWMAAARRRLREANEMLDERVRRRTAELERANFALQERETLLIRQAEELSQSNADLEQFAYVASHDLQEPLRMIAIYTELLEQRSAAKLDEESGRFMRIVLGGARRMEQLVYDLLTYSRVIHADLAVGDEIDSGEALRAALLNLETQVEACGAVIDCGEMPKLALDRVQLTQIFQSLIGNALKYRAGEAPRVAVRADWQQGEWIFSVSDNGIGIHADYHETIFRPFKRLHGQRYPGSGVGLAICRRIVDRVGGRIWVKSDLHQGATFYFSIPTAESRKSLISKVQAT
jgi:signal transduction histidine kinase